MHTLAYSGMGVFQGYGANLPTQLWIAARYMQSLSLLAAPFLIGRTVKISYLLVAFSAATLLLLGSIFYWQIFPVCFVDGVGLTLFKKISEYVISLILLGSICVLLRKRDAFEEDVLRLLVASIVVTIASELAFTFYVHVYGLSNLIGHFLKIVAFYLIYKAIVETGLRRPFALLFRDLRQSEMALRYRLAFEDLVSDLSTQFITMPAAEVDQSIEKMLRRIGRFAEADGGYVFLFSKDKKRISMTHLWRNENLSTRKEALQNLDTASMPWWMGKLTRLEPVVVSSLKDLPAEAATEKEIIQGQGIQAVVDMPMVHLGEAIGFMGFSCVQPRGDWTADEVMLLKMVGQIITNALKSKETEDRITRAKQEWEKTFDAVPDLITILDMDHRILRANKAAADRLGFSPKELVGRKCYDVFHGTDSPPGFCPHAKSLDGGHERYAEVHEDRLGGDFLVSVSPLIGSDGKQKGVVHVARDVTRRKEAEKGLLKAHDELEKRVEERTAELGRISSKLLSVQEDERKRISRELHDSIGQSLAAIKVVAESALSQISQGQEEAGAQTVKALVPLVQDASDEVRRIYTDLRPSMLDDLGIVSTISWFCREFENVYPGIHIEKRVTVKEEKVPEKLKIVIFRVLQESLNNVSKYSKADHVTVSLYSNKDNLEFVVRDNGQGFDKGRMKPVENPHGGFGLTSMKERTELSGGTLDVESYAGEGVTVRALWPLGEKREKASDARI
jgi:PAS domain S-box-containing protein